MTILQQNIKNLRKEGKSYTQIQKILKCSKGTIAYSCSDEQKMKAKKRSKRYSTKKGALYKKLQGFCYNYGKFSKTRKYYPIFDFAGIEKRFNDNPKCYLTGENIDLKNMKSYSLDHINPVSKGGKSNIENMGLATRQANQSKSDLTLKEFIDLCVKVLRHNSYSVEKK